MSLLTTRALTKSFGENRAVDSVDFNVEQGEVLALIGSNGAGKTSLVNLVSGLLSPDSGQIIFEDNDVTQQSSYERIKVGIARSFQLVNLFDHLSCADNVALSIFSREGKTQKLATLASRDRAVWDKAHGVLRQFNLDHTAAMLAGTISHGERKLLDVAVAYALSPKLLFLDEPTSGVSTREKAPIMDIVSAIVRAGGITVVIIEHDMDIVFRYSERIVVMHQGSILADGSPDEIRRNDEVTTTLIGTHPTGEPAYPSAGMLDVDRIEAYRGRVQVLRGVSLRVEGGESVVLVGRNGAGKTTTIETIMGLLPARAGEVSFKGGVITRLPAYQRALLGIGYAPEDAGIFPDLTVAENFHICEWLARPAGRTEGSADVEARIFGVFPEVKAFMQRSGLHLSGGQKKMVAVARAMALSPSILLLDEPFEGLAPVVVSRFIEAVNKIKAMGISLLIAESNLTTAIRIADRLYAIDRGEIIFEGSPKAVSENDTVMKTLRG